VAKKKRRKKQRQPRVHVPARFAVGASVRVKPGTVDPDFPDIPLGGWVGTITEVDQRSNPREYLIVWDQNTLDHVHPVYRKRCRRDDLDPGIAWLPENDLEPNSGEPVVMKQPVNIVPRPLRPSDQDDRIRAVFGLTSDDPLPSVTAENLRRYHGYLAARLSFPFAAHYLVAIGPFQDTLYRVTVVGLLPPEEIDEEEGLLCRARQQEMIELPLTEVAATTRFPNGQLIDDYSYWFTNEPASEEEDEEGAPLEPPAEEVAAALERAWRWQSIVYLLLVSAFCGGFYGSILGAILSAVEGAGLGTAIGGLLLAGLFALGPFRRERSAENRNRTKFGSLVGGIFSAVLGGVVGAMAGAVLVAMITAYPGALVGALAGLVLATLWTRWKHLALMLLGGGLGALVLVIWRSPEQALMGALYGAGYGAAGGILVSFGLSGLMQLLARHVRRVQQSEGQGPGAQDH